MEMQRQAYRIDKVGSTSNLKLVTEPLDDPQGHEVQVEVHAIGLNFADVFAIHGLYSATPKGSFVPGLEFSGVISKIGKDIANFKVGDRIMGVTRFGGYASHLNIDDRHIVPLADDWSFEEGASYLVQGMTAYYALVFLGGLQKQHNVLIHSGAGGVGIMANRIAKCYDAFTIGTIGSNKKMNVLEAEGFDGKIVRSKNFGQDLEKVLDGRELNLIVETIGGEIFKAGYNLLAPQGRMVVVGASQFASPGTKPNYIKLLWKFLTRPKIDPQQMIQENRSVMGFNLIWLYEKVDVMDDILQEMSQLDLGKPMVGQVFDFDQIHDAIKLFQSGKSTGKVVVKTKA
ncbi:zinc-binding dehydrogenase [Reichenbachiella carrageenanivorans]|uniref:Zinc-binding dehydrogenase n=1 Tax=Reichenbachiella carrageenanivorans TaxID=2979869 RepID=A0ABY6CZJ1_9BACT|nr:zinc-binding dehydrogenase [Reichenbachiella carrageenanivorans]UXX79330.1 zinc-binding dehydrogenase [Reichenbachiella carrageenanivorans]